MSFTLLQALGFAVLSSLWQVGFLYILFVIFKSFHRDILLKWQALLAQGLIGLSFVLFLGTFGYYYFFPSTHTITHDGLPMPILLSVQQWVSIAYLFFLLIPIVQGIRSYVYLQKILTKGLEKAPVEIKFFMQRIKGQLGISRAIAIYLSSQITSPVTVNIAKPVILLPVSIFTQLTNSQVEALIIHELHHIRRYDFAINLFLKYIQGILYFNPFVHLFAKIIEAEREQACDEMVLHYAYNPLQYAEALLTLKQTSLHANSRLVVAATGNTKYPLLNRVQHILGIKQQQKLHRNRWIGFVLLLSAILALCVSFSTRSINYTNSRKLYVEKLLPTKQIIIVNTKGVQKTTYKDINSKKQSSLAKSTEPHHLTPTVGNVAVNGHPNENWKMYPVTQFTQATERLSDEKEQEIDKTVISSKKIFESQQEKQIDIVAADVLYKQEKELIKQEWQKNIQKMNWENMRQNLRNHYDDIQWDILNQEMNLKITAIKLDSLAVVLDQTKLQLLSIGRQLKMAHLDAIPDTDITLSTLEIKQQQVEQALKSIKKQKTQLKKVINL